MVYVHPKKLFMVSSSWPFQCQKRLHILPCGFEKWLGYEGTTSDNHTCIYRALLNRCHIQRLGILRAVLRLSSLSGAPCPWLYLHPTLSVSSIGSSVRLWILFLYPPLVVGTGKAFSWQWVVLPHIAVHFSRELIPLPQGIGDSLSWCWE